MLPARELASPQAMTEGCFKAVIWPSTINGGYKNNDVYGYKTASGNLAFNHENVFTDIFKRVTKPQAVIRPSTLWLAHGSQSGLKALQWKVETLFIAKTAKLLTRAVLLRLRQKQNAPGASLTAFWQTVCLL